MCMTRAMKLCATSLYDLLTGRRVRTTRNSVAVITPNHFPVISRSHNTGISLHSIVSCLALALRILSVAAGRSRDSGGFRGGGWPFLAVEGERAVPGGGTECTAAGVGDCDGPGSHLQAGGVGLAREVQIVEVEVEALVEAQPRIQQRGGARGKQHSIQQLHRGGRGSVD